MTTYDDWKTNEPDYDTDKPVDDAGDPDDMDESDMEERNVEQEKAEDEADRRQGNE